MFKVAEIKNRNRHRVAEKIPQIPLDELFDRYPEENRPMPFFSVVPEQLCRDLRYQDLSALEQGYFLRLCIEIMAPGDRGRYLNHPAAMVKRLRLEVSEWRFLEGKLLHLGILKVSPDSLYIVQPELREQCIQFARYGQGHS